MYLKCPVPGCTEALHFLTNTHCKLKHNMTKAEVLEKYGKAELIEMKRAKKREENK